MAREKYEELQKALEDAQNVVSELYGLVHNAKLKYMTEQLSNIVNLDECYNKKLDRLGRTIKDFVDTHHGNVSYGFKKVDVYLDDFHDPMPDPLEWMISEYNLLGMSDHMEIIFKYSQDFVKYFVQKWIDEKFDFMQEEDPERMFGFKN
jgi:hypothetical protein